MAEEKFPGPIEISLAVAKEWQKRYDEDATIEDPSQKVKAFLIPRETLEKVLELKTEAVWAYIGINDQSEKTLLFVGAELDPDTGKYINVYGSSSGAMQNRAAEEDSDDDVVYDGTRPSPPF